MGQPLEDISSIRGLVAQTRRRLRLQTALEAATTAVVPASAAALVAVFLVRTSTVSPAAGVALLAASALLIVAAGLVAGLRRLDDEVVARRVDRASGLADRLSTAIAFERQLARDGDLDDETRDFMTAAIRDAVRAAPRANVVSAAPFRRPRDLRAAAVFAALSTLAAGLAIPTVDRTPFLYGAHPDRGRPGAVITLRGTHLLTGVTVRLPRRASLDAAPAVAAAGAADAPAADAPREPNVPEGVSVFVGAGAAALPAAIQSWSDDAIEIRIPDRAPVGPTTITAYIGRLAVGPVPFTVLDPRDKDSFDEKAVALDDDDLSYLRDLLHDMRHVAKTDNAQALDDFVAKIEKLLEQAERGELTKEDLLDKVDEAFNELSKGGEKSEAEVAKDLAETGKELKKDPLTAELGKALEQGDLTKAKEELEKLADKMDKGELTPEQQEKVAKAMEKAAEQFEQREQQKEQIAKQKEQELEAQVRKLEKQRDQAKNEQQRQEAERQLDKKQRELKQLQKDQKERQESEQRRALKRLHKDMDKAAKQMQQKPQDQQQQQEQQQQASRSLRDVARETGRVDQDQRKQAAQKKVASQMEDLREAMRRAKQRGSKGPQDPFNKNKQNDFQRRAGGKQGSRQAWQPGQKGQGQNGQQPGQQGQGQGQGQNGQGQQGGDTWGDGHDDNLVGDPTAKSGTDKDQDLTGTQGRGSSRRETILAAAQKGFASRTYEQVYADYKQIVEEVMRAEKVPPSYKFYVKKYFNNIKPHAVESTP